MLFFSNSTGPETVTLRCAYLISATGTTDVRMDFFTNNATNTTSGTCGK